MICLPTIESTETTLDLHIQWLSSCLESISDDEINLLLQAYVAVAILHDLKDEVSLPEVQILERITSRLHGLPDETIRRGNTQLLALVAVSYFREFRIRVPAIDRYLQSFVDGLVTVALETTPVARPLLYLTSILGFNSEPMLDTVSEHPDLLSLLSANHTSIRNTLTDWENLTVHGVVPISLPTGSIDVLEIILLDRLQQYDLDLALRLMRLLNSLSKPDDLTVSSRYGFQTALYFLKNNQHPDGYFGFLEPEIQVLSVQSQPQNLEIQLKLQLTFSYLWFIAELSKGGYGLFKDISFSK